MEQAFIQLINHNRALIFKVCNFYCRDPDLRKDLFQEIVLQLWKSFPAFRKESGYTTWVYRVALNTAISNFRKEARKPGEQSLSLSELEIPDIYESKQEEEHRSALHQAIDQLSQIEKAIVLLYLDELSYEEISMVTGISITNVGVRLSRIRTKLSKLIKAGHES